jgi:phosphoglycerate-specific signal transduction histidine kinase
MRCALQQIELAHVTRVATLGELTASIAHEVNQPLGALVNNAGAEKRRPPRWTLAVSHVPRLDDMQVSRTRRTSRKDSAGRCLRDAKYFDGIATAAERHRRQGFRLDTGLIPHRLRYEQRRSKFLI